MSYSLELLPGEPILIGTWHDDFVFQEELPKLDAEACTIMKAQSEPIYFIVNIGSKSFSFEDILMGANMPRQSEETALTHAMNRLSIFVTTNRAIKLAAKGLNTVTFGNIDVKVFDTLDEALSFVRTQAA